MRNFRNAAVATATAITLAASGTSIALAETSDNADASDRVVTHTGDQSSVAFKGNDKLRESDKELGDVVSDGTKGVFDGKGSSHYVTKEDANTRFDIRDAAGKETNVENMPQWARLWVDGSIVAGIGALVGLVIAGINYASYNGWIHLPNFNI